MSRALFRAWSLMAAAHLRTVVVDLRLVDIPARHDVECFPEVVAATTVDGRVTTGGYGPLAECVAAAAAERGLDLPVLLAATGSGPRRVEVAPCACDEAEEPCGGCGGQRVVYWPKAEGGAA